VITADTITDEEIVDLRNASVRSGDYATARRCDDALSSTTARYDPGGHRAARARIAEILNARAGEK
jgi:hypothetical protein